MEELGRTSLVDFKTQAKIPIIIALDNIRSMNNIGSIFRTCDAFAIEKILLGGISATPPHREIHKTALGSEDAVEWQYCPALCQELSALKGKGYQIASLEQTESSISLASFNSNQQPVVLVFGNEVDGVSNEVLQISEVVVEIPQFGTKHSLNVAVSAGIAIWHLSCQFRNLENVKVR